MIRINPNFSKLQGNYLFIEINRRTAAYQQAHPEADIIRLGIGDVTCPLAPAVVEAMRQAVEEMGSAKGFHG